VILEGRGCAARAFKMLSRSAGGLKMSKKSRKGPKGLRENGQPRGEEIPQNEKGMRGARAEALENVSEHYLPWQASGVPSLIQSRFGNKGNFELVTPLASGGLAHYWRNNDSEDLPWYGPVKFGFEAGNVYGVSLIEGNFGKPPGNLELAAVDMGGRNLLHFWRDSGPSFDWSEQNFISEPTLAPTFLGNPAMIRSSYGNRGNFEIVIPLAQGGLAHYWRDNDDPALPWYGPFDFGSEAGLIDAVSLMQSNFGARGNLELAVRSRNDLMLFWRESGPKYAWNGPFHMAYGVSGNPSMIQSSFGNQGNFELAIPSESGGIQYFWRDNDDSHLTWYGPLEFGTRLGKVDAVSLIQSNFGTPGNLELVARIRDQLALFWQDSGPDRRWNGPYFITPQ